MKVHSQQRQPPQEDGRHRGHHALDQASGDVLLIPGHGDADDEVDQPDQADRARSDHGRLLQFSSAERRPPPTDPTVRPLTDRRKAALSGAAPPRGPATWLWRPRRWSDVRVTTPSPGPRRAAGQAGMVRVRGPARSTCDGSFRPMTCSASAAAAIIASRSIPVATPMSSTMWISSSVAMLLVAPGAYGQPPRPPTEASKSATPSSRAASTFASPVPRVLWKCRFRLACG